MNLEQIVQRFQQAQAGVLERHHNCSSADYYGDLLSGPDSPVNQFYQDMVDSGLEPGGYDWARMCDQVGLMQFMGDGPSTLDIELYRQRRRHAAWCQTPAGLVAILQNPDLARFDSSRDGHGTPGL